MLLQQSHNPADKNIDAGKFNSIVLSSSRVSILSQQIGCFDFF